MRARPALVAGLMVLAAWLAPGSAAVAGAAARPVRAPAASQPLALVFPLVADDAGLRAYALSVSTPGSPDYGRFASIPQLAARFGASLQRAASVASYLRQLGARGVSVSPTRMYVQATLTAGQITRAFGTRLTRRRTVAGAEYLAPDTTGAAAVRLPPRLRGQITGVVGLDTAPIVPPGQASSLASPPSARTAAGQTPSAYSPRTGTATGCTAGTADHGFAPNQYLTAYGIDSLHSAGLRGAGERVAVIEIDGYKRSDIDAFGRCFGIHVPPLHTFTVGLPHPLAPGAETALDLEVLTAAAPRLASLDVYENQNNAARLLQSFTAPLVSPGAKPQVISASLGLCEPFVYLALGAAGIETFERDLELAASAGISVLAAAGDNGSSACQSAAGIADRLAVSYPASSAFVTAVGGTNLHLTPANTIASEQVWNDTFLHAGAGGGGFSALFDRPSYQSGVVSVNARAVPDVALLADLAPGYAIYCSGGESVCRGWVAVGGTSAAAPLLAGGLALVDQDLARHHRAFIGLANPLIYRLARSTPGIFNDVTHIGNDLGPYLPGAKALGCCSAEPGFDAASGWGSLNLAAFDRSALTQLPLAPDVRLTLPAHQRPLAAHGVIARVRCSSACRAYVVGEVALSSTQAFPVHSGVRRLTRAGTAVLKVGLTASQIHQVAAAVRAHRRPFAELFGVALDAKGQPLRVSSAATVSITG